MDDCGAQPLAHDLRRMLRPGGTQGGCAVQLRGTGGNVVVGQTAAEEPVQAEAIRMMCRYDAEAACSFSHPW